jgi:hypothetical protein
MSNTTNTRRPAARAAAKAAPAKATPAKPASVKTAAKPVAKSSAAVKPAVEAPKRYRLLTGIDDSQFCARVSEALDNGYELYGSPAATFNGKNVIVAQAVVLKKLPAKKKSGKKK